MKYFAHSCGIEVENFTFFAEVLLSLDVGRYSRGAEYDGEKQHLAQVIGYHPFVYSANILRAAVVCRFNWTTGDPCFVLFVFCVLFCQIAEERSAVTPPAAER